MSSSMPKNNSIPPDEKLVRLQLNVAEEDAPYVKAFVRAVRDARRLGLPRPEFMTVSGGIRPASAPTAQRPDELIATSEESKPKAQKSSGKDRSLGALLGDHLSKKED